MEYKTNQNIDATKWVLNEIQSNRGFNSRSGKAIAEFYYKEEGFPDKIQQQKIITRLCDKGAIQVISKNWGTQKTKNHGTVNTPNNAPWDVVSNGKMIPRSLTLKIFEDKLSPFLYEFNIMFDEDKIKYTFNSNEKSGMLIVGEEKLSFSKERAIILEYFYKNKDKLNNESDFETYKNYLIKEGYGEPKKISEPFNKVFRDTIHGINKRINTKVKNIETVISEVDKKKKVKRNKYKWKIKFKNI